MRAIDILCDLGFLEIFYIKEYVEDLIRGVLRYRDMILILLECMPITHFLVEKALLLSIEKHFRRHHG